MHARCKRLGLAVAHAGKSPALINIGHSDRRCVAFCTNTPIAAGALPLNQSNDVQRLGGSPDATSRNRTSGLRKPWRLCRLQRQC